MRPFARAAGEGEKGVITRLLLLFSVLLPALVGCASMSTESRGSRSLGRTFATSTQWCRRWAII
jgi:hypothetical protein